MTALASLQIYHPRLCRYAYRNFVCNDDSTSKLARKRSSIKLITKHNKTMVRDPDY